MKLILSLTVTLGLMAAAATAVSVVEAAPAAEAAAVVPEAVAQEEIFDSYQSPPIWTNGRPIEDRPFPDDDDLPIQFRHGGARGGWGHGHDRDRIGTGAIHFFNNKKMKKRAAVYGENAHFSLGNEFGDVGGVNAQIEAEASSETYRKVKRDDEDEEDEEDEEEEEEEEEDEDVEDETEDAEENEEENGVEADYEAYQSGEFAFSEFMEDNQAEDEEAGEEEEDEDEEARLDSEAGLEDWIEEMKSEEYFNLAGHPTGEIGEEEEDEEGDVIAYGENEEEDAEEDEDEGENSFNEDEPSPSEEELFAAAWHH